VSGVKVLCLLFWCLQAEARLAARRQARAEAREIRMRELERQQKEIDENADSVYDMYRGMYICELTACGTY
jgi:Double stranded RNA binding protein (DUF2051).